MFPTSQRTYIQEDSYCNSSDDEEFDEFATMAPQSLARVRCVESSGKWIDLQPHQVAVTEVYALMIISEVLRSCPGTVVDKCY